MDTYDHTNGLEVTLPDRTSLHDLLVHLNLEPQGIGMMFMNGRPAAKETQLKDGAKIRIFQPIFGG